MKKRQLEEAIINLERELNLLRKIVSDQGDEIAFIKMSMIPLSPVGPSYIPVYKDKEPYPFTPIVCGLSMHPSL